MGYDMYVVEREGLQEPQYYYGAYGMTMQHLAHLMRLLKMAYVESQVPEWPTPEAYGCTYEDWNAWRYPDDRDYDLRRELLTPERLAKVELFNETREAHQAWHGSAECRAIPMHKLLTNDHWHVLDWECAGALQAYEQIRETTEGLSIISVTPLIDHHVDKRTWTKWLEFLQTASTHGGFRVG